MKCPSWLNPKNWSEDTKNAAKDVGKAVVIFAITFIVKKSDIIEHVNKCTQKQLQK